ncbi:MAG: HEAT repeat domain-containing protein [Roseofilum sp. Belize BBD 4]|uniref:phycobilisome degradation protein NblB n=1 Tax=Roseofilum sp. Belize BBD 4 TaxID=2821500 RepID=UPI001AFDC4F9|nr:HEAT repeat domain-containing protein [Roseofilum sp. Belize BBD 4]MBP0034531.1 HEAT repeat domain-containing protein [Roseofilum sp. Belize BBD 4]
MSVTPESVQQLLDSENYGDRLRGVNQLRLLDPAVAFSKIQALAIDSNVRVRYAAISQLSTVGEVNREESLNILRDRLENDPEIDVKAAAADGIGALHLTEGYPDLEQAYGNTEEWLLQMSIVATLGELGDPRALTLLKVALNSPTDLVRSAAVSSVGELGDPEAVELLFPLVDDPDWQVRHRVAQALHSLGGEGEGVESALNRLAQDPVDQVAIAAKNTYS